jgi:DNA-binding winged helix-turn-helix (wHTH) protein
VIDSFSPIHNSMQGVNDPLGRVVFGAYEVDLRTGELRKHGVRIRLQAQPFRVLEILLEHPGAVVTREKLKGKLWPANSFGDFDHGLNKAINKIREALADSPLNPRYVETVAGRGYRFIAVVTAADEPAGTVERVVADVPEARDENQEPAGKPIARRGVPKFLAWTIVSGCLVLSFAAFLVWKLRPTAYRSSDIRSLAVLPLENSPAMSRRNISPMV